MSDAVHRLVLFDIDGTLLSAGGAGGRAFLEAIREVFGADDVGEGVSFAGKTDPQIAHEVLGNEGVPREAVDGRLPEFWPVYLRNLHREIAGGTEVRVLPGVPALLDALGAAETGAVLGLLTGNVREGARAKLHAAGLAWERFPVGAFGSDHADRGELPTVAVRRAESAFGRRFRGKEVVVIGDTPLDIACGERLGVRTVAVATGSYTRAELAECAPDHLFPTLEDTDAVLRSILDP